MYTWLLYAHSWNRWLVLAAAVAALGTSYRAWLTTGAFGSTEERAQRAFAGLLDLQVLLGLTLYALSPIVRIAWRDMSVAMTIRDLRFFSIEHITGMVIALAFLHAGGSRVRRAETEATKARQAAIWQTLAAISIAVSIPWWRPLFRS
jgi:hypothetical protein